MRCFSNSIAICSVDFPPSWHDLIISHCVKQVPINLPQKFCSLMQIFFMKKFSHTLQGERRDYTLPSYLFPFLKVSSLILVLIGKVIIATHKLLRLRQYNMVFKGLSRRPLIKCHVPLYKILPTSQNHMFRLVVFPKLIWQSQNTSCDIKVF